MPNKYMYASGILHKKKERKKNKKSIYFEVKPTGTTPPPFLGVLGAVCLYVTTCYYFV